MHIEKALKETYGEASTVTYYGATSLEDRTANINKFETNPECRFFIANPKVGGMGITLNAANYSIFYNSDYNYEDRRQAEDRNYRIGQNTNVTYIDIIAQDTIEQDIINALVNKNDIATTVLRDTPVAWLTKILLNK